MPAHQARTGRVDQIDVKRRHALQGRLGHHWRRFGKSLYDIMGRFHLAFRIHWRDFVSQIICISSTATFISRRASNHPRNMNTTSTYQNPELQSTCNQRVQANKRRVVKRFQTSYIPAPCKSIQNKRGVSPLNQRQCRRKQTKMKPNISIMYSVGVTNSTPPPPPHTASAPHWDQTSSSTSSPSSPSSPSPSPPRRPCHPTPDSSPSTARVRDSRIARPARQSGL